MPEFRPLFPNARDWAVGQRPSPLKVTLAPAAWGPAELGASPGTPPGTKIPTFRWIVAGTNWGPTSFFRSA